MKSKRHLVGLLWVVPLAFLALFYFYPLGSILQAGFARSELGPVATFMLALGSARLRGVVGFTLWQALLSTLLTLAVGLPGAYVLAHFDFRGKRAFRTLTALPFVMPTLVVAAGFLALLGPNGWINAALMRLLDLETAPIQFINTFAAILVAHIFYNTTIVLRLVGDYWTRIDARLLWAAQALGANPLRTWLRVTLPLLLPAILAAALLVFIFDFSSFAVVLVLGGPRFSTLEVEIFYQTTALFNLPLAAVLAIIQMGCTLVLTILYTRLSARVTRPLRQRSLQRPLRKPQRWPARIAVSGIIVALTLFFATPMAALAMRSVSQPQQGRTRGASVDPGLTLAFYQALFEDPAQSAFREPAIKAVLVSLGYAGGTVVLALLLGLPTAWLLSRDRELTFNRWIDPILMLPLGTSAVTLGLGFIVALNQPPLDLRASPWLIPLAHTLVAFPFVVRSLMPALASIQPRLRHAAAVLGAAPGRVWWTVDAPLVGRAVLVAAAFAFAISLGEFGATAMLARPEFPTIPFTIYRFLGRPGALNYGQAMAMSTILLIVTGAGILLIERLRSDAVAEF